MANVKVISKILSTVGGAATGGSPAALALGVGQAAVGAIKQKKQKKADAMIPQLEDPEQRAMRNLIARKRRAYDTGTAQQSTSEKRLVDTYKSGADAGSYDKKEVFYNEWWRLPSGAYNSVPTTISGTWDSSILLGNGSGQVYNGSLRHPSVTGPNSDGDFNGTVLPTQTTDYGALTDPVEYYRILRDDGNPHSDGWIQFENLITSDIDPVGTGDVNVEIKLPSVTGWLDLGTGYDSGTYSGVDGDGCQNDQTSDRWQWIVKSPHSTSNSGYLIIVRITIRNTSKSISEILAYDW